LENLEDVNRIGSGRIVEALLPPTNAKDDIMGVEDIQDLVLVHCPPHLKEIVVEVEDILPSVKNN
jgi:hypothetical protein